MPKNTVILQRGNAEKHCKICRKECGKYCEITKDTEKSKEMKKEEAEMKVKRVWAVFFSPTGSTEKITVEVAVSAAQAAGISAVDIVNITEPSMRTKDLSFGEEDLVVFGMPVYAGRVPNKIMPFVRDRVKGNGAACAAVVTYGGRSFDDGLSELSLLMKENGFLFCGGGAFVCRHAFASALAAGRPNDADISDARSFGKQLGEKTVERSRKALLEKTPQVPGNCPPGSYYVPKGEDGLPAVFLKAKPVTDQRLCTGCGFCAERCPMGSIREEDFFEVTGICIKCQACIKGCPTGAKHMEDEAFLSHKKMLEKTFASSEKKNLIVI